MDDVDRIGKTGEWIICPRCKGSGDERTASEKFWYNRAPYCGRCKKSGVIQLGDRA